MPVPRARDCIAFARGVVELERAGEAERQENIIGAGEVIEQLELLEDEPDVADAKVAQGSLGQKGEVVAQNLYPAVVGAKDAGNQAQERGFSTAARADHGDALVLTRLESVEGELEALGGVAEADVLEVEHGAQGRRQNHYALCREFARGNVFRARLRG